MRFFLIVSLLIFNFTYAQYGTQDFGQQGGQQDSTQGQPKGGTGLERKGLLDSMDISDKTSLDEGEKCKSKCDMIFIQCYRIETDRGKCYSSQQECLGKCPGGGEAGASSDFGSPPAQSGGVLEFGN